MTTKNTYLICARSIGSDGKYSSEPGETQFLKVPLTQSTYSSSNALSKNTWKKNVISAADGKEDEITGSTGDILFFVHGYN
ncbi:hypothetical protein ACQP3R_23480, partial [Bacillus inaquosorum]|uniref:hypothetical protein n=1 Tax=Bacillus inaquosorum TaxID=483913 RepID=UPI003D0234C2